MKIRSIILSGLVASAMLSSCASVKEVTYFQDAAQTEENGVDQVSDKIVTKAIRLKPEDKISIIVNSKNPQLAALFNLPIYTNQFGVPGMSHSGSQQSACYTINSDGDIIFPVLGKVKAAGYTKYELSTKIAELLVSQDLIKDPTVTIEFMNLKVSVIGEVNHPGVYNIVNDCYTIYDALAAAGDLNIYGVRTDIQVMRTENGKQQIYHLNINSAEQMVQSEGFCLQQNDVVYVKPNKMRQRQATVNGNNLLSASFWVSIASLTASIINIALSH